MADRGSDTGTNVHVQESVFTHPLSKKKKKKKRNRKEDQKQERKKDSNRPLTENRSICDLNQPLLVPAGPATTLIKTTKLS